MGSEVRRVKRHRMEVDLNMEGHEVKIVTRFSDSTRAGRAACYLNSGEVDKRIALEVALTCVFAPLREAQEGATPDELEESISQSQAVWDGYMNLARQRCKGSSRSKAMAERSPVVVTATEQRTEAEDELPLVVEKDFEGDANDTEDTEPDINLDKEEI